MMKFKDKETMECLTVHYEDVKGNIKMHRSGVPWTFQRVNVDTLEYEQSGFYDETKKMVQCGDLIFERTRK